MVFSLLGIFLTIMWIIIGTSFKKFHPFLVLLIAPFLLAILLDISLMDALGQIKEGFGNIIQNIGLLILFGTIIGFVLDHSKATLSIANWILMRLKRLPLAYSISFIGYLVSIPVFCDAAFVILSQLNKTLSQQTKTPLVGLTVALSTGLFAPHVLIPPTPGPLAAAANLNLDNIMLLIVTGGALAFILILVGGAYGNYLINKNPQKSINSEIEKKTQQKLKQSLPSFTVSILPIIFPIFLMCLGGILTFLKKDFIGISLIRFLSSPSIALFVGMLLSFRLIDNNRINMISKAVTKGIEKSAPILMITGMGGALGSVIQNIPLQDYAASITSYESLGILIPFAMAALIKTAQGSSTVAIITASSIIFPLMPILGLEGEIGKIWAILAIGVGSMTVSHANDSYFWIVSQMSDMDIKTAYRTHTLGTFFQGTIGLVIVLICYSIWKFI